MGNSQANGRVKILSCAAKSRPLGGETYINDPAAAALAGARHNVKACPVAVANSTGFRATCISFPV